MCNECSACLHTYTLWYFYTETNQMHQFLKFILFWNNILHVSDSLYNHHQEFKIVYTTTGGCQTDTVARLLAGTRWNCMERKDRPGHVRVLYQNKINLRNWCIWLVLLQKYITIHGPMNVKYTLWYYWTTTPDTTAVSLKLNPPCKFSSFCSGAAKILGWHCLTDISTLKMSWYDVISQNRILNPLWYRFKFWVETTPLWLL